MTGKRRRVEDVLREVEYDEAAEAYLREWKARLSTEKSGYIDYALREPGWCEPQYTLVGIRYETDAEREKREQRARKRDEAEKKRKATREATLEVKERKEYGRLKAKYGGSDEP